MAAVVKRREDGSAKLRIIIDMLRSHVNEHLCGRLEGAVPPEWMAAHRFSSCLVCSRTVALRYNDVCPRCRPTHRARTAAFELRSQPQPHPPPGATTPTTRSLPTLEEVHTKYVPVIRHIPKELRHLWARCLAKTAAQATLHNDVASWTLMLMLVKCTLAAPPRAGKAHAGQ